MKISERVLLVLVLNGGPMTSREIADVLGNVSSKSVAVACTCVLQGIAVERVYGGKRYAPARWMAK